ncbi:WD40-repeat-containing domain protein [Pelagophyceae sp. CCMP2097]|nr:WD40-repeat-containing domain protein [Pelagophyceae sp. CCMP2097]|mmetsp:Transcript_5389/g.17045  ORF Transcript_5389/g.17045 Transcript_5389/m.17045 type:complete len:470 (-) Transcript_5389:46-1455(-)
MAEQVSSADAISDAMNGMDVEATMLDDDGEMMVEDDGDDDGGGDDGDDGDLEEDDDNEENHDDDEEEEEEVPVEDLAAHVLEAHSDSVYACAICPQTLAVLTGGGDDKAFLFRTSDRFQQPIVLDGHTDSVTCVGFSHDGQLAATGSYDGRVQIWVSATGARERLLEGPSDVEWLQWHPKGDVLLAGAQDGTCWMWLARSGECLRVFAGHDGAVLCGTFTCDGKGLATGSADGTVRVWAPKKGTCKHTFGPETTAASGQFTSGAVTMLAAHPSDPDLLIAAAEDGCAAVLHLKSKRVVALLPHSTQVSDKNVHLSAADRRAELEDDLDAGASLAVVAVGLAAAPPTWAATGGVDGALKIWDFSGTAPRCRASCAHGAAVTALQWHPSEPRLYSSSADRCVRLWDARSGVCLHVLTGHGDVVLALSVAFSHHRVDLSAEQKGASTDVVLSAGDDHTARVFDVDVAALQAA